MKCEVCGKAPWDGVTLLRQNAKGQPGIWRCESHSKPAPPDLAQAIAEIQTGQAIGPNYYIAGEDKT